jgi:hypothetical protein
MCNSELAKYFLSRVYNLKHVSPAREETRGNKVDRHCSHMGTVRWVQVRFTKLWAGCMLWAFEEMGRQAHLMNK